jgi:hypothetical protein
MRQGVVDQDRAHETDELAMTHPANRVTEAESRALCKKYQRHRLFAEGLAAGLVVYALAAKLYDAEHGFIPGISEQLERVFIMLVVTSHWLADTRAVARLLELAGLHRLSIEQNWIFPNYFRLAFHVLFNAALVRYSFVDCPALQAWFDRSFPGVRYFLLVVGLGIVVPAVISMTYAAVRFVGCMLYCCSNRMSFSEAAHAVSQPLTWLEKKMGGSTFEMNMRWLFAPFLALCLIPDAESRWMSLLQYANNDPTIQVGCQYFRMVLAWNLFALLVRFKSTDLLHQQVQRVDYRELSVSVCDDFIWKRFFPNELPLVSKKFRAFFRQHGSTLGIMLMVGLNDITYGLMLLRPLSVIVLGAGRVDEANDGSLFKLIGVSFLLRFVVMMALNRRCQQRDPAHKSVYPGPWPVRRMFECAEAGLRQGHAYLFSPRQNTSRIASEAGLAGANGSAMAPVR